jgi:hypothetical protein
LWNTLLEASNLSILKVEQQMKHAKTLIKHYTKRVINSVRYINLKENVLEISGWKLEFPVLTINYTLKNVEYINRIEFNNIPEVDFLSIDEDSLAAFSAHIGIVWAPVFFKVDYISVIYCRFLNFDRDWCEFHKNIIENRMREFRFLQGLNFNASIAIIGNPKEKLPAITRKPFVEGALVLNGGGKDSATSAEILKEAGIHFQWFTVGLNSVRKAVVDQAGVGDGYHIRYYTDDKIRSNSKFSYTPLSGPSFYSTVALFVSYLKGLRYIVLSNEYSANDPNIVIFGVEINHQFSKSYGFESLYSKFIKQHFDHSFEYFSLLRPLYELAIVQIFKEHPKYFDKFISCNIGISKGAWCCDCEKCAFICLCFGAFFDDEVLLGIFGKNLLESPNIRKYLIGLCDDSTKAWECVGVKEECQLALRLFLNRRPSADFNEYPYRADLELHCKHVDIEKFTLKYLNSFNSPHLLPPKFECALREIIEKSHHSGSTNLQNSLS